MTMLRSLLITSILVSVATAQQAPPPHPMFEGDRVHVIHLTFAQPNWYDLLVQNFEQHDPPLLSRSRAIRIPSGGAESRESATPTSSW